MAEKFQSQVWSADGRSVYYFDGPIHPSRLVDIESTGVPSHVVARIHKLRAAGLGGRDIAALTGWSHTTVYGILSKANA